MKIKTITCHDVYNHGAALQAYALMRFLSDLGHDVEIIDYKPDYLSRHYDLLSVDNPIYKRRKLISFMYILAKLPFRLLERPRKYAFDEFKKKHLFLTKRYNSYKELKNDPPHADVYVCGSDQIWNTLHKNGKDPAFYLDFGGNEIKRASYAASLATDKIYDNKEKFVFEKVKKLDYVSCRELSGVNILHQLGIDKAKHVMDPAFLLSAEKWNEIAKSEFSDKYILVYDFDNCSKLREKTIELSKKYDLKIYAVNPGKFDYVDRHFKYVGPDIFLSLIRDAQIVISNSFHAVVFPLIFKTDFVIMPREENINERMSDLLRYINQFDAVKNSDVVSFSNEIEILLNNKVSDSKKYLENILNF